MNDERKGPSPIAVRCRGINSYLVDCLDGQLLIDPGWPHCLHELKSGIKETGLRLSSVRYAIATHAHPDHAGGLQTLKRLCGVRLLVHERQVGALDDLNAFFERKPDPGFEPIVIGGEDIVVGTPNRAALAAIGVRGEIVETPGHSDDSVTLVTDEGWAFTGDLTRPDMVPDESAAAVIASWKMILARGAAWIYPGHGGPIGADTVEEMLRARDPGL
jgi:glyoxylase-like metal-dependent hydrolase (beta-lactamase superfamily II)